jgi:hypothetical protein
MQVQPNRWSCVPTAFAMCLNLDVKDVITSIGHDGSEIVRPEMPEPRCRRAFLTQELYKICINNGKSVTPFHKKLYRVDESTMIEVGSHEDYINLLLDNNIGVICGSPKGKEIYHAVAWDGENILDPHDIVYSIDYFDIDVFQLIR